MKRWMIGIPVLALLLALAPMASAADGLKENSGQAQVLHVTYYYLPG